MLRSIPCADDLCSRPIGRDLWGYGQTSLQNHVAGFSSPPGFDALRYVIAAAYVFLAPCASASDAPGPSAPTVEADSTLSEIVVTAERGEESIANVPISITAFSQKKMDDLHIENFTDLASIVPGLTIQISA